MSDRAVETGFAPVTLADAMARNSEHAAAICALCAQICKACAEECAKHEADHCKSCAQACLKCAQECDAMARAA